MSKFEKRRNDFKNRLDELIYDCFEQYGYEIHQDHNFYDPDEDGSVHFTLKIFPSPPTPTDGGAE